MAGGAHLVGGVAGHHLIDRGGVVEESVRRVAHRTDHGELVVDLGELGQDLGEVRAGNFGGDRLEGTLHIVGNVLLRVPKVEVTGSALQVNHDDALGLAPTGSAAVLFLLSESFGLEERAERHAEHTGAAYS